MLRRIIMVATVLLLLLSLVAATVWSGRRTPPRALRVATWNMEWMVTPATAHAARLACRAGRRGPLPCDVARRARDSADIARVAAYAAETDADVFAFQEVESAAIAARIFGSHVICMAPGKGVQHVGFAIRRGLAHRCGPVVESLSLGGAQRAGLILQLSPGTPDAIQLLAVHLKSGCADADLESGTAACVILRRQAEALAQWITAHAGARFILLGDFNRGDADVENDPFWRLLRGEESGDAPFVSAGHGVAFVNCHLGAPYARAIDHVLVSRPLQQALIAGSYLRFTYRSLDAMRYRLPDHCPVRISLNRAFNATAPPH